MELWGEKWMLDVGLLSSECVIFSVQWCLDKDYSMQMITGIYFTVCNSPMLILHSWQHGSQKQPFFWCLTSSGISPQLCVKRKAVLFCFSAIVSPCSCSRTRVVFLVVSSLCQMLPHQWQCSSVSLLHSSFSPYCPFLLWMYVCGKVFSCFLHPCCPSPMILHFLLYLCNGRKHENRGATAFPSMSEKEVFTLTLMINFVPNFWSSIFPYSDGEKLLPRLRALCSSLALLHPNAWGSLDDPCLIFILTIDFCCLETHFTCLENGIIELDKK